MPFDFGGTRTSDSEQSSGGFNTGSKPGSIEPSSPLTKPSTSSGGGGFTGLPKRGGSDAGGSFGERGDYSGGSSSSWRSGSSFGAGGRARGGSGPRRSIAAPSIPWGPILIALLAVVVITLLWSFRNEITDFLAQVLSWVIIIVVVLFVLRIMLFGGRRR